MYIHIMNEQEVEGAEKRNVPRATRAPEEFVMRPRSSSAPSATALTMVTTHTGKTVRDMLMGRTGMLNRRRIPILQINPARIRAVMGTSPIQSPERSITHIRVAHRATRSPLAQRFRSGWIYQPGIREMSEGIRMENR